MHLFKALNAWHEFIAAGNVTPLLYPCVLPRVTVANESYPSVMFTSNPVYLFVLLLVTSAFAETPSPVSSPLPPPTQPPLPSGLTGDLCTASRCLSPRSCFSGVFRDGKLVPCDDPDAKLVCFCFPPRTVPCGGKQDCPEGEACFKAPTSSLPFCAGETSFFQLFASPVPPTPTPTSAGEGLTQEPCKEDADCQFPRTCVGFPRNGTGSGAGTPPPQNLPSVVPEPSQPGVS